MNILALSLRRLDQDPLFKFKFKKFGAFLKFSDCPNGFIFLSNQCYRWLPASQIDNHLKNCHLFRGNLLQISPKNSFNEKIASVLMTMYQSDVVYAGIETQNCFYAHPPDKPSLRLWEGSKN